MQQVEHSQQYKIRLAKQFSRAARHYDSLAGVQRDIAADAMALLPSWCGTLLDIGCGTGRITRRLLPYSQKVIAMDLALGMLQHAWENDEGKAVSWLQGDAEHLAFADCTVDTVFSSMALQWCASPMQVMTEIYRVLKVQGQAVLAIMSDGSFTELEQVWSQLDTQRHINQFHTSDDWLKAAHKSGLNVKVSKQVYQTWHPNLRTLLASIRGIGANVLIKPEVEPSLAIGTVLSRSTLAKLESHYLALSGENRQLPLSYQITFLQCVK